jgi:D-alanyl-lipoteichoic acid acyltransferase DltB (MBOAT superfamily)
LQLIGYLADVYWGISKPQRNLLKFSLFISYFPQIMSGPISRYSQMEGQLFAGHTFNYTTVTFGMQRILWGLFKKMVVSERLAPFVNEVFSNGTSYSGAYIWIAAVLCAVQIYTDFSGNMDLIMGVSECFDIRFPENFKTPFFSKSFQEFWQRWHITLGVWLRNYIMSPILASDAWRKLGKAVTRRFGKKAGKLVPAFAGMLVLWLTNALWHGGSAKYVIMVLWYWAVVTLGQLFIPVFQRAKKLLRVRDDVFSWRLMQRLRTFLLYSVGVLLFRADTMFIGLGMLKAAWISDPAHFLLSPSFWRLFGERADSLILVLSLFILFAVEAFMAQGRSVREWVGAQNLVFRWAVYCLLIFFVIICGRYGPGYNAAEFIYAGF